MSSIGGVMDLLTFKAFRPHVADPTYSIKNRLKNNKSVLAFSVGGSGVYGYKVRFQRGQWEVVNSDKIEGPYLTPNLVEQGKDLAQTNVALLSFTPANLLCELETGRLPDDANLQKSMLTNPRSILKNRYEQDRRYQLIASGDRKKYLSFSVPTRDAGSIEKMIKDAGMEIARVQIGLANVAEMAIRRIEASRRDGVTRIVLVGDQSMIFSLAIRDGGWEEPFSFISRASTSGGSSSVDSASVVEYLESIAGEIEETGAEFYMLHGEHCWWTEYAQKWFEDQSGRFQLKKFDDVASHVDLHLIFEG
jgi:hypothetical protein